jgi:hypothetical protein
MFSVVGNKPTIQFVFAPYHMSKPSKEAALKPFKDQQLLINAALEMAITHQSSRPAMLEYGGLKVLISIPDKKTVATCSYATWYAGELRKITTVPSVICMSNSPYIWYCAKQIPMIVLRSYAGGALYPEELSKAAFGESWDGVPFYEYTHILFGDKHYLQSIISIKQKRLLKEAAIAEKWSTRAQEYVTTRIDQILVNNK